MHCEIYTDHHSLQHLMTQRELNSKKHRWMKLLKDYDKSILYHLGKANLVGDALSQKAVSMSSLYCISVSQSPLVWSIQSLANLMV